MKKASMILSHLSNQPQFKYLKQQECYTKFISLLSAKWQKAIAFVYVKNGTLFIAVTHPGFKMELHYNRDLLKTILTQMLSYDSSCKSMSANDVVIFHSKYRSIVKEKEEESTVPYYSELASPNFDIDMLSEELKEKFKETQILIEERIESEGRR